jgi:hypothetical protein
MTHAVPPPVPRLRQNTYDIGHSRQDRKSVKWPQSGHSLEAPSKTPIIQALDRVTGRDDVIDALSSALAISIVKDAMTHRLWYDIRNQALFDETFRSAIAEIEAMLISMVSHMVSHAFARSGTTQMIKVQHDLPDGVFHWQLLGQANAN